MEPCILTQEGIRIARTSLALTARRRLIQIAALHLLFGLAAGLVVYLATSHNLGLASFLGTACAAFSAFPVVLHWRRYHAKVLRELDAIERDVLSGMVVYNTTFEILARNAELLSDRT